MSSRVNFGASSTGKSRGSIPPTAPAQQNVTHDKSSGIENARNPSESITHDPIFEQHLGAASPNLIDGSRATLGIHQESLVTTDNDYREYLALPKMDNFVDFFSILCSTALIFGGLIPYIPQYLKIKRSMSADGFSSYVCLTLFVANIMRIMFWFGHHFELPLLIQSFVMIAGMLAMMEICIRVRDKSSSYMISAMGIPGANRRQRSINGDVGVRSSGSVYSVLDSNPPVRAASMISASDSNGYRVNSSSIVLYQTAVSESFDATNRGQQQSGGEESISQYQVLPPRPSLDSTGLLKRSLPAADENLKCSNLRDFWDWDDLFSYLKFLSLFTLIVGLLTYLLIDNYIYIETIGFIAVLTESMLGVPQLLRNHRKKSTSGMSVEMVVMWLSGDLFKTLYSIIRKAPVQFWVCGSTQIIVDILILVQVLWYRRPSATYRKLPKST